MMTVIGCIAFEHNIWLVLLAAIVCAIGSFVVLSLFGRTLGSSGSQRVGWQFLTAMAAGSSIWATHFVAMLAYEPVAPVSLDGTLTIVSLLIAVAGTGIGFVIAASGITRFAPLVGGGLVGVAIACMHYAGMLGYRVEGVVSWDRAYLDASVAIAIVFSAAALHFAVRRAFWGDKFIAIGMLIAAIVGLHFTGMTALHVSPLSIDVSQTNPDALHGLAVAIAGASLLVLGTGLVSYLIDDSSRAEADEQFRVLSQFDALTGLPNRASFNGRLRHKIEMIAETGERAAMIAIDLDRFKEVNDLCGHGVGDDVLRIIARRMSKGLRAGEFLARLGGDEFAAIKRIRSDAELTEFLARLRNALMQPVHVNDRAFTIGASVGVAIYPNDATSDEMLINNASLAMYRAQGMLTEKVCFYERSMDERVRGRRRLAAELKEAAENEELELYYQVQKSVGTGEILGYEALLRWRHPIAGFIPPSDFIPLAEENGLILQIGAWVLRRACYDAASWEPRYRVAVNLSAVQFGHSDLPTLVREALKDSGLAAERLELELTESTIIADKVRSIAVLKELKALGATIAIDDFGTGYSSLDTLRSFPFDKIKLDRSFMSDIETNNQAIAILRAVMALGKSLDIAVLAEGIETEGQRSILESERCDEAQGYLLGRPAPLRAHLATGELVLSLLSPSRPFRHSIPQSAPFETLTH